MEIGYYEYRQGALEGAFQFQVGKVLLVVSVY
jgi:hypothetical protein